MLPRGIAKLAGRTLRLFPDGLTRRVLPSRLRYDPAEMSSSVPPSTPVRLLIAPMNYAGQGREWARAAERFLPGVGAVSMYYRHGGFGFPADLVVPASGYVFSKRWQEEQRRIVTERFTHVLIEAARHPFGRVFDQTAAQQARALTAAGVSVALLFHGTDIRLPSRHRQHEPLSPFGEWDKTAEAEREARANRKLADELGVPVFVSTLGLLDDVPAVWLPVVVDVDRWRSEAPVLQRERPVVAHAPSMGVMKGSELIDPIMTRLDEEGLVEYRRIGGVPAERMPEVYRDADVVLDQFRLGDYGVAACEALAAGRIVVGHVQDGIRSAVEERTGQVLPIVEAVPDGLERVIREIAADRERYRAVARTGPAFAAAVHDGRMSAEALASFLESPEERA